MSPGHERCVLEVQDDLGGHPRPDQEIQLLRKDGTPVWVLFNVVLLEGPQGTQMAQSTLVDISKRKRAEEDLLRREEDLRRAPTHLEWGECGRMLFGGRLTHEP